MQTTESRTLAGQQSALPDFLLSCEGTLFLLTATNHIASEHVMENVSDHALWWCGALVVEHPFIADLSAALTHAGFTVAEA